MSESKSEQEEPERSGPIATFRVPYFFQYWLSNLLQFFSFNMQVIAGQWLMTDLTPSRTMLGMVGFSQGIMVVLASPFAGVAVDRMSKRNLMIVGRTVLVGTIVLMMALVVTDVIRIWHIIAISLAAGLIQSLMQPATQTYVYDIVGRRRVQNAMALNFAGTGIANMAGPALAGALIALVGVVGAFFSAAAGLMLGVFCLWIIPISGKTNGPASTSPLRDIREGFVYVIRHKPVLFALLACSMAIFNGAMFAMRPIFARYVLDVGSVGYGVMGATMGLGSISGAIIVAILPPFKRPGLVIALSMWAFALCLLLYSFAFSFAYILVIEFALGVVSQMWNTSTFSGLQMAVPAQIRGRVVSMVFMVVHLSFVGQPVVGILADKFGDQVALGIFGAAPVTILGFLIIFGWRHFMNLLPLDHKEAPVAASS